MLTLLMLALLAPATTTTAAATQPAVAGQVLGKTIFFHELGIDPNNVPQIAHNARDDHGRKEIEAVSKAFALPLLERFKKERNIDATEQEMRGFAQRMRLQREERLPKVKADIAQLQEQLKAIDLPPEQRRDLEQKLKFRQQELERHADPQAEQRDMQGGRHIIIIPWKLQRELHRKYGGRIIFQQFGPEALDAMRQLYEEAEKTGDLRFDHPRIRDLFYHYYEIEHTVIDPDTLEKPWFLPAATEPSTQPAK